MERMKVKYVIDGKDYVTLPAYEMLEDKYKQLEEENKTLTKCNLNLQEWLDNKEKVNKSLREENKKLRKYYDRDKEELMESCYSLARENDELKKDVDYRHHRAMVAERGGEDED